MQTSRSGAALATASLLGLTGVAVAATPIRDGWYEAGNTATAVVAHNAKSTSFAFKPKCATQRFRTTKSIHIKSGGVFSYKGAIASIPQRSPNGPGPVVKGSARISGKFTRTLVYTSSEIY